MRKDPKSREDRPRPRYRLLREVVLGEPTFQLEPVEPRYPAREVLRDFRLANQRHRRLARKRCDALLATSLDRARHRILCHRKTYLNRPLVEEILRRVEATVHTDPGQAHEVAGLALFMAEEIGPGRRDIGTPAMCRDLKALCHAHLGNTSRVLCRWEDAEENFQDAIALLWDGVGDLEVQADTLRLYGSLLRDLRRTNKALRVLHCAARDYEAIQEFHRQGLTLLKIALLHRDRNEIRQSLSVHAQACALVDERRSPMAVLHAWINLALIFANLNRFPEARRVLESLPTCLEDCPPGSLIHLSRAWVEGIVAEGLQCDEMALEQFNRALEGYEALDDVYNVALVSLEILKLHVKRGEWIAARERLHSTLAALKGQPIERETRTALKRLLTALTRRQVEVQVIEQVASTLLRHPLPGKRAPSTTP